MSGQKEKTLPKNATEAQGLLIKAVYEKYGSEALPLIEEALGRQGRALGLRAKSKLPDNRLSSVGAAFAKNFDPSTVDVVALSDDFFHIRGKKLSVRSGKYVARALRGGDGDRPRIFSGGDGRPGLAHDREHQGSRG